MIGRILIPNREDRESESIEGLLVELVEQQPATRCVVGSTPGPAGSALEVWPWTSVLNSLLGK